MKDCGPKKANPCGALRVLKGNRESFLGLHGCLNMGMLGVLERKTYLQGHRLQAKSTVKISNDEALSPT